MMTTQTMTTALEIFDRLGIADKPCGFAIGGRYEEGSGPRITTVSPIDGGALKDVGTASVSYLDQSACIPLMIVSGTKAPGFCEQTLILGRFLSQST